MPKKNPKTKKNTKTKKAGARSVPKKAPASTSTSKASPRKKATRKKAPASTSTSKAKPRKKATASTPASTSKATPPKKATSARKSTKTSGRSCNEKTCRKKKCKARALDGRSLADRARDCQNLEECRKFIEEMSKGLEQANTWLDEMHTQALSAEHTRDLYAEQISDLLEAIDIDRARIAQLEAELEKARKATPSSASDAVMRKLSALSKDVRTIQADLERLAQGRQPRAERRQRIGKAERTKARAEARADRTTTRRAAPSPAVPTNRRGEESVGPFAKYSVLRGAACSLGVGKHGYPPEVCAPAYFDRSEAAQILGTYAQNDYSGLARWALITGFPIDDNRLPQLPTPPKAAKAGSKRKTKASQGTKAKAARKAPPTSSTKPRRTTKVTGTERSSQQILDQVLLTVARI